MVVAVAWPRLADVHDLVVEGGENLDVDRATVVFAGLRDRLVVHGDEGSVQDQGVAVAELAGDEQVGDRGHQVADGPVCGGLADTEDRRQCPLGQVGAQRDEHQQHWAAVGEPAGSAKPIGRASGGDDGSRCRWGPCR